MRKYAVAVTLFFVFGWLTPAPARADMPAPEPWLDNQLATARNVLEGANAPQAIQALVHGSGDLIRADYTGIKRYTSGFRLFYTYYWKSNLSDNSNRTELSFDFDDAGTLERCNIGRDSSFLPAFSEAQLVLEVMKELLLSDRDVKQHPKLVRLIQQADAPQILVLILNLRMASLALSRR